MRFITLFPVRTQKSILLPIGDRHKLFNIDYLNLFYEYEIDISKTFIDFGQAIIIN